MSCVSLDRQIVDLDNREQVFHVVYDLDDRYQVPGAQYLYTGRMAEYDGYEARWRGIYDDNGRLMVAICHNMDLGDSWEHADNPQYPEKYSALGIRIALNYIVYSWVLVANRGKVDSLATDLFGAIDAQIQELTSPRTAVR